MGGGPGGMQAAVTAAQRGHQVTLAEATDKLGGLLKFTDYDDLKVDLMRLKNYLIHQVEKNAIELKLNTTVTPEFIKVVSGYDAVILAVGSTPSRPRSPVWTIPPWSTPPASTTKLANFGKKVAVLGGGLVGCETGLYLAENGHDATIIEMQSEIAPEANWMHKEGHDAVLRQGAPITCRTGLRVARIEPGKGVYATNAEGAARSSSPLTALSTAMGMRPNTGIVDELKDACIDTIAVGDCVKPRKARQAMEGLLGCGQPGLNLLGTDGVPFHEGPKAEPLTERNTDQRSIYCAWLSCSNSRGIVLGCLFFPIPPSVRD